MEKAGVPCDVRDPSPSGGFPSTIFLQCGHLPACLPVHQLSSVCRLSV